MAKEATPFNKPCTLATDRRHGDGGSWPLLRLVEPMGTTRSTPGYSHTTQTRPSRGLFVIPTSGSVLLYKGCAGSVTIIVSVGSAVMPSGVLCWLGFCQTDVARATELQRADGLRVGAFNTSALTIDGLQLM